MKNKLHTILIASALATWAAPLAGQQMPWCSVYGYQPKYFNPAAQGGPSGGMAGVVYRSQFADLPTGSRPVSYMAHVDVSPLISDRIGLGLTAMQDEAHLTKRTNVAGFFGYHLFPKENEFRLSLGAMAGILSQRLELGTATVNDPFDLALMQATESKMQFDGGFGLQAQFGESGGSGFQLDVVLPQLFTSDFEYTPTDQTRSVRSDMLPHLLTSLRYRWQGEGFAVEPNVAYRESFDKKLKAANFDFNVRGYFLENDMVMVGAGYRTGEGGLQFSAGVKPVHNVLISGSYETHSDLGSSFEAGVQYTFGDGRKRCEEATQLTQFRGAAEAASKNAFDKAVSAREKIELARFSLNEAKNTNNHKTRQLKLANADRYFPEIESLVADIKAEAQKTVDAHNSADQAYKQATASGQKICNARDMDAVRAARGDAAKLENDVVAKFKEIKDLRGSIKMLLDVKDPASIQTYLTAELGTLTNKPDDIKVLQVTPSLIEIQYADANEAYKVTDGGGKIRAFADWLGARVDELKYEGLVFESARLAADLQYSDVGTPVEAKYGGEYGAAFKTPYKFNGKDKTSNIKKDALTLETLAVMKLYDLKRYMASKIGVSEDRISLEVTAPNPKNEYQQMTRVVLNYKK